MSETAGVGYSAVLRAPRVFPLLSAGALGRLPGGILPFTLVVAFANLSGFALAGVVAMVFMLATAFTGPYRGRLVDRGGNSTLVTLALVQAAAALVAVLFIGRHWTIPAILAVAICSATAPPVSAALRARWSAVFTDKDRLRQVHTIDSIAEEVTFIVAPLIATAAMRLTSPAVTVVVGSLIYWGAVGVLIALPADRAVASVDRTPTDEQAERPARERSLIRQGIGQGIVLPIVALGVFSGGISVVVPAIASAAGDITSAGYLLAVFSVGGAVGGLIYGKVRTKATLRLQYLLITAYLTATSAAVAFTAVTMAAYATVFLAGAALTPMFVVAYLLVDEGLPRRRQVESNAWLGSGYNVGSGAGSALCGLAVASASPALAIGGLSLITLAGALAVLRIPRRSTVNKLADLQTSATE